MLLAHLEMRLTVLYVMLVCIYECFRESAFLVFWHNKLTANALIVGLCVLHDANKKPGFTLSNPAVGETVLTPVKWCCNTGEVPIRIKKTMDEQTSGKKLLFSLILYKRLQ